MMITAELYILYGFLGFICLLLVMLIGILRRQSRDIGELKSMIPRVERLEDQIGTVRQQMAEVRGLVVAMHDRMDLLMRPGVTTPAAL